MSRTIRSKAATDAYREGFDQIRWPKRGRAEEERGRRARRGGRYALSLSSALPKEEITDGVKAAMRVLAIAESPKERDMNRSLMLSDGQLANPSEVKAAMREVRRITGW